MPTILGGHENLDTRQVCANLLRRPAYEISPEVFENTCQPMFREKITSYCFVVLALWLGLSLYQVYSLFRAILVKRLGGSQTIQIINEVNKKPTIPKKTASKRDITCELIGNKTDPSVLLLGFPTENKQE